MDEHPILRIKNWQKYQHYRKRRPPWIKLHFSTLNSKDWVCANDCTRLLAIVCMLVASQSDYEDGRFEADPEYFHRVARLDTTPDFKSLLDLHFLEIASTSKRMLANDTPETEQRQRTEAEKPRASRVLHTSDEEKAERQRQNLAAKMRRLAYEKSIERELNVGVGPR